MKQAKQKLYALLKGMLDSVKNKTDANVVIQRMLPTENWMCSKISKKAGVTTVTFKSDKKAVLIIENRLDSIVLRGHNPT